MNDKPAWIWKTPAGMEAPDYLKDEPNWNLWCGPDYKPGESGLITLRDTYSHVKADKSSMNYRQG